ncbi:MAG: hypothetical protein LBT40_08345 [Deltaproteobacteria bacterium]|nr:hypothetical protein [Deltaproteobacteria bacterium]
MKGRIPSIYRTPAKGSTARAPPRGPAPRFLRDLTAVRAAEGRRHHMPYAAPRLPPAIVPAQRLAFFLAFPSRSRPLPFQLSPPSLPAWQRFRNAETGGDLALPRKHASGTVPYLILFLIPAQLPSRRTREARRKDVAAIAAQSELRVPVNEGPADLAADRNRLPHDWAGPGLVRK